MTRVGDRRLTGIEDLYRDRFQRFLQVATASVGNRESALEAVQDGFADALRSRQSYRGECPLDCAATTRTATRWRSEDYGCGKRGGAF